MTTRIQIHEIHNGWASLDGHGPHPVFFARSEEECVSEALRRKYTVTLHDRPVVAADQTYATHPDGTIEVLLGCIGVEVWAD